MSVFIVGRAWSIGWVLLAGVEVASGIHTFLKKACRSSISWRMTGGNQIDTSCLEPDKLAASALELYQERSVPWSYYQNVVTPRSVS